MVQLRTAVVALLVGAVAVACSSNRSAPTGAGAPLGPSVCTAPEAFLKSGLSQHAWKADSNRPFTIAEPIWFHSQGLPPDEDFTLTALSLIVGERGAVGSPTALQAGKGVLVSNKVAVRRGAPVRGAEIEFVPTVTGRYPVWALVEGTCKHGHTLGADPVGYIDVRYSPSSPCQFVDIDGRRYRLSEDQPQLGPAKFLGTGHGSSCGGEKDGPVTAYSVSEESSQRSLTVNYGRIGNRHYFR